jgi:hypothetical protein
METTAAILGLIKGNRSYGDIKNKITKDFKKEAILEALLSCRKLITSEEVWSKCAASSATPDIPAGKAIGGGRPPWTRMCCPRRHRP